METINNTNFREASAYSNGASHSATAVRTVPFHGAEIVTVEREGVAYVGLKTIAEHLGLDWSGQLQRIKRNPIFAESMVIIPMEGSGGSRDTVCLRLDLLQGWLFTVEPSRVKDEAIRSRLIVYQRECHAVLAAHFGRKRALAPVNHHPVAVAPTRGRVRHAKLRFAEAVAALDDLGVDVTAIDLGRVVTFAREILR